MVVDRVVFTSEKEKRLRTSVTKGEVSRHAPKLQVVIFHAVSFSLVRGYTRIIK